MKRLAATNRAPNARPRSLLAARLATAAAMLLLSACVTVPARDAADDFREMPVLGQFDDMTAQEIAAAGDQAWRDGELERAVFIYMQSLTVEDDASVWLKVGKIQQFSGQTYPAWQAFERVIALEPENAEAYEHLGLLYIRSRQKELAVQHLEKAVALDATRWVAANALGVLADAAGDYQSAIGYYELALAQRPESAMLLTNLGYSYYLAGDLEEAEKLFNVAIGVDGNYRAATANLGLVRARRALYDSAVDILEKIMDRAKALNDVGYIAFVNGDIEQAERLLGDAVRESPTYYETAYENLDRVRAARAGDRPRAEEVKELGAPTAADGDATPEYRQVKAARLNVRKADSIDAPIIGFLAADNRVRILLDQGAWSFVSYEAEDGPVTGWVMSGFLAALPSNAD